MHACIRTHLCSRLLCSHKVKRLPFSHFLPCDMICTTGIRNVGSACWRMFVIMPRVWVTGSQLSPLARDEPPSPFTRQKVEKQNRPDRSSASFSGLPPTHCFKLWMAGQRQGVGLLKKASQRVKDITLNDNGPTVYPHIRTLVYSPSFQWPSVISPPLKPLQLPAWYSHRADFESVCVPARTRMFPTLRASV